MLMKGVLAYLVNRSVLILYHKIFQWDQLESPFLKGSSRRHDTFVVCANVSLFESKLLTRWITFSINQIRAFVVCGYPGRPTILDLVTSYVHTLTSPKIRGGFLSFFGLFRGRGWVFSGLFRGAPPLPLLCSCMYVCITSIWNNYHRTIGLT